MTARVLTYNSAPRKQSDPVVEIIPAHLPTLNNHQVQKRRSVGQGPNQHFKRVRLTEKNLRAFEKMEGREQKSDTGNIIKRSSTTSTTDRAFCAKLEQNNMIYADLDIRRLDDFDSVKELLDESRESEPPDLADYQKYLSVTQDYENELCVEIAAYPLLAKRNGRAEASGYLQRPNHI